MSGESDEAGSVLFTLADQLCGLPVEAVRDILDRYEITTVPLAPPEIAGHLNLRGRVVTAVDLRRRFSLPPSDGAQRRAIVVEHEATLYAFLVDDVREVRTLPAERREPNPACLGAPWSAFALCLYRLDEGLVALLDHQHLLAINAQAA